MFVSVLGAFDWTKPIYHDLYGGRDYRVYYNIFVFIQWFGLGCFRSYFWSAWALFSILSQKKSALLDDASRKTIVPILVINLVYTFIDPQISITGHIGGLIGGYVLAMLIAN